MTKIEPYQLYKASFSEKEFYYFTYINNGNIVWFRASAGSLGKWRIAREPREAKLDEIEDDIFLIGGDEVPEDVTRRLIDCVFGGRLF